MTRLEIRVPISPTPDYFRRIHFMAASLRRLAHAIGDYCLVVCVGGDVEAQDLYELQPWSKNYPIIWRWIDRERFRQDSYWETSHEIFRLVSRARYIMCADADIVFVRDFSDLLEELDRAPAVAGVIAHVSPFMKPAPPFTDMWPEEAWHELCAGYGIAMPALKDEHTGWGFMTSEAHHRFSPPYFNFGMVVAPAEMMEQISAEMPTADEFVKSKLTTIYRFQIALTLAILKRGLPSRALPVRYNYPNHEGFDQRYPEELADIRVLHYLKVYAKMVDRKKDFASLASVAALVERANLRGSNEVFRRCIEKLYPTVAKEEEPTLKSSV